MQFKVSHGANAQGVSAVDEAQLASKQHNLGQLAGRESVSFKLELRAEFMNSECTGGADLKPD